MINYKAVKWSIGLVVALGLTSCMNMMQRQDHVDSRYVPAKPQQHKAMKQQHQQQRKMAQKTYSSKDPVQKSTPGPARKAAPQLPVIQ